MTNKCPNKSQRLRNFFSQLYDRFKPAQYQSKVFLPFKPTNTRNRSYADSSFTTSLSNSSSNKQNTSFNQKQRQTNEPPSPKINNRSKDITFNISQENIDQLL